MASCKNTDAGFECTCPPGYEDPSENGTVCDEINECDAGTHNCSEFADCKNTPGSFDCSCPAGYHDPNLNGTVCDEINECDAGTHNCSEFAFCDNTPGSFDCSCQTGYSGNGLSCLPAEITGDLTTDSPGYWEDNTYAESCQEYRYPPAPYQYTNAAGDGYYLIDPDGDNEPAMVYCDMTTDGGGWTGIDAQTAHQEFASILSQILGTDECTMLGNEPSAFGTGEILCRYDIPLGFSFNTIRLEGVQIKSLSSGSDTSDLSNNNSSWGVTNCLDNYGDFVIGTPAHPSSVLSLGANQGAASCQAVAEYVDGSIIKWNDEEAYTTRDTVLRMEFGEEGVQVEGWQWIAGTIFVRDEVVVAGALTQADPGEYEDGTISNSCAGYLDSFVSENEIYGPGAAINDGLYTIDLDGEGPTPSRTVFCDMTHNAGGWIQIAHVRRQTGMPTPGCDDQGSDPAALGYSIDATGIPFSEIAVTHNGLAAGSFASFTLDTPTVFDCSSQDIVFLQANGRYSIFSLSAAASGGWGDIPLACFNAKSPNCLNEVVRTVAFGAVATGVGNCQQLNFGNGTDSTCGAWGLAPYAGNSTWTAVGGRVFIR